MAFLLFATIALIYLLRNNQFIVEASVSGPSASAPQVNSRRHDSNLIQVKKQTFLWRASLDRCTGIASSFEQSTFNIGGGDVQQTRNYAYEVAQRLFSNYPEFLGKTSLTLGLCRSVPSSECCNLLRTSILPLDVLTFGKPVIVSPKKCVSNYAGIDQSGEILCRIEIPIVGGLLANVVDSQSSTSKNKSNDDNGCIRFIWIQTQQHNQQEPKIILITEIAGNYRPSLAGSKLPVPAWRRILYCSTQRMFHAYVMWRFHGFVAKEYERNY